MVEGHGADFWSYFVKFFNQNVKFFNPDPALKCWINPCHGLRPDVARLLPALFHRDEVTDVAAKQCSSRGAASGRVRGVSVIKHSPEELIIVKLSARTSVVLYKPFDCFRASFKG